MYGKSSSEPPNWSVHAEFTILHEGVNDPINPPETRTERDDNGVRMTYTWTSQPSNTWATHSNHPPSTSSLRSTNKSAEPVKPGTYEFQRGNLLFSSSTPLRRPRDFQEAIKALNPSRLGVPDSGYNSELLSPSSFLSSTLPRRTVQPYNRKCKSTCSIVLSTAFNEQNEEGNENQNGQSCSRAQSLRCQTPTARLEPRDFKYYGCGDPWCYHSKTGEEMLFSPVPETIESSSMKTPSRTSTYTTNKTPTKGFILPRVKMKDASVQTAEMVDKCTSPFLRSSSFIFGKEVLNERTESGKRRVSSRRRTEPVFQRTHSPSSYTPDSLESQQVGESFQLIV